jgi:hypothetical protein
MKSKAFANDVLNICHGTWLAGTDENHEKPNRLYPGLNYRALLLQRDARLQIYILFVTLWVQTEYHGERSEMNTEGVRMDYNANKLFNDKFDVLLLHILTYLLTALSPSWEAANCAATQEPPSIL